MDKKEKIYQKAFEIHAKLNSDLEKMINELAEKISQKIIETDREVEQIFINTDVFDDQL